MLAHIGAWLLVNQGKQDDRSSLGDVTIRTERMITRTTLLFGNPAIFVPRTERRPEALRPRLAAGLPFESKHASVERCASTAISKPFQRNRSNQAYASVLVRHTQGVVSTLRGTA